MMLATSKDGGGSLNPMSFSDQHGNAMLERLRYQRTTGRFCDVCIVVKDRQFNAHRMVLAASSPYFDSILRYNKITKEKVTVNCQNAQVFEVLLNYMYSGNVVIDRTIVTDLLKLANNLLMVKLKRHCVEYLERYIDVANCLSVKDLAVKYNLPTLLKRGSEFFDSNVNGCLLESIDILKFTFDQVRTLLSDPKFQGTIRPDVHFSFLVRWCNHRFNEREAAFKQMVAGCPLQLVNPLKLERMLDYNPFFGQSEPSLYAVLTAMYNYGVLIPKYEPHYRSLVAKYEGRSDVNPNAYLRQNEYHSYSQQMSMSSYSAENDFMTDSKSGIVHQGQSDVHELALNGGADEDSLLDKEVENAGLGTSLLGDRRPSLKLKINLHNPPETTGKRKKILGKAGMKFYRKSVTSAGYTLAKRRGRPPKLRAAHAVAGFEGLDDEPDTRFYDFSEEPLVPLMFDEPDEVDPEAMDGDDEPEETTEDTEEDVTRILHSCEHCPYQTKQPHRLKRHNALKHSKHIRYICNICHFECTWNRAFYDHMRLHFSGPPFQCDDCPYTVDRIHVLLSHRLTHTGEKPYKCSQCDFRSRSRSNLVIHHRVHTGEKPFECVECHKRFAIKATLDQHMAVHSEERPFACDQCSFASKYQSHLISHRRVHTGDLFRCQEPGCDYSSPKKSQLAAHLRTHLAVRCHQCKICHRSFIEKSHLVRHERIHLEDKPFKCSNCDYASSRRDKLKEHILKHHNTLTSKQHRRRHRRAKQLAQLAAQAKLLPPDPSNFFRPIQSSELDQAQHPQTSNQHSFTNHQVLESVATAAAGTGSHQRQQMTSTLMTENGQSALKHNVMSMQDIMPPPQSLNRPLSASLPNNNNAALTLSPSLSLNFDLQGTDEVDFAGTSFSPRSDQLITPEPLMHLRNPHSVNSSLFTAESFLAGNIHQGMDQSSTQQEPRPMSLPPYGAQLQQSQLQAQEQSQSTQHHLWPWQMQ